MIHSSACQQQADTHPTLWDEPWPSKLHHVLGHHPTSSGQAALFGFVGVPAERRAALGSEEIKKAAMRQLANLFGSLAASPRATLFKDWAADPLTATADDRQAGDYPISNQRPWVQGEWQNRVSLIGSETSLSEPGYLAGAVEAAELIATETISRSKASGEQAIGMLPANS